MLTRTIGLLLLASVAGCAILKHEAPPEDVDKAAALFFERLTSAEYDTIYGDGSRDLKKNKTKSEVVENLTQLTSAGRLGRFVRLGTYFTDQDKKRLAVTRYRTDFEKSRGSLTLYFVDESGEWKLGGFEYKLAG